MITMKEIKEEILNPIILLESFVELNKGKFSAGKVVFDKYKGRVIKQVGFDYRLITNEDLIRWLKQYYPIKFLEIYKTPPGDTYYINGYFPTMSWNDNNDCRVYLSFEIANSYSSRFLPLITLGLYFPTEDIIIRTPIKPYDEKLFTRGNFKENEADLDMEIMNKTRITIMDSRISPIYNELLFDILVQLPISLTESITIDLIKKGKEYKWSLYSLLIYIAKFSKDWSSTAYESARKFQHNLFNILTKESQNV